MKFINTVLKKYLMQAMLPVLLAIPGACAHSDNSMRSMQELVNHMAANAGGTYAGPVFVPPVKASEGISMTVEGRDVFFYKYDLKLKKQKRKFEQIKKSKVLYINGIPYKVAINGCFVMIEHETNVKKKELIAAFEKF